MSRFEQFPRSENKKSKKDRAGSSSGAEDAVNALLELATLGIVSPPNMRSKKKKK